MNDTLLIGLLVGATVLLLGLLVLLMAAGLVIILLNRRLEQERYKTRKVERQGPADLPIRSRPTPTPISRSLGPPPAPPPRSPFDLDEAATEVMGEHHLSVFRDDTDTGTTEVKAIHLPGELDLDESEETTAVGVKFDPENRPTDS